MVSEVFFNGPEGRIEARYNQHEDKSAPIVLVLHPHPLHGGTMNNKVVYQTFHTLAKDFSVLRFNFPGVGNSQGAFDHGVAELMAAAAAMDWLQLQNPNSMNCWIAGFSFGSWIALQLLMRRPEINGFIAISPPANKYDFNFLSPCPSQGLIIQGTNDEIVPEQAVYNLYEKLDKQRNSNVEYYQIVGADHFYNGYIDQMKEAIEEYVKPRINSTLPVGRVRRDRRRRQVPID